MSESPEDLPEGWITNVSKKTGKTYYYNTKTGESQWEKPAKDQVRASHLLVKHDQSRNPSSWKESKITRSKDEAIEILKAHREKIANKEVEFADLASTESDCGSAQSGGDLGWFGRGEMQKPFEEATYALAVGELSDVVDTASGVHIILRTG
mmetsp:Transcript_3955/g.5158  ORF Transcript_3955/g.5158 Transcript_3955/m.5158 type:complete len:152 (+) Transcript_3955:46-501(+)|eukprot:CAMPEP_0201475136 /NCGR_PEP_ID=MMETSP0151_2-20130828/591_1 /ASSEMBLY_ACC=CAM_ASM_000257 /TAXON_ID=200890 /ORGANISM="Paramoeba atlantica, Strain 621/1 / CCAP 1560/9" /LENGTH=151 /DNA_ID=CAMNT_0047855151 /DNA_START=43 /DNA_END=498 /DNA_ORIENTATION=-